MTKILPKDITSYDLLKSFAVIIMIIDHLGYYFFPDELIFRAIGRIGFPIWFFLIGHASGRDLPTKLLIGIGMLMAADIITGLYVFPLSALVTIALLRISIDKVMAVCDKSQRMLWIVSAILFVLVVPSFFVMEYGAQAMIMAILGYMVRHEKDKGYDKKLVRDYTVFAGFSFLFWQQLNFGMSTPLLVLMGVGTAAIMVVLRGFDKKTYPKLTAKLPMPAIWSLQFMGRRTLEIYVGHLVLFKFLCLLTGDPRFVLFDWQWFYILNAGS
ncbi:MAG TPA: hypothetical protein EYG18_05295 [Micavibrio sp.]|nr:hypothetical protein [Micavibrio sp.]HIL28664.1 hypothetical protein [Micavibrio sp.]